MAEELKRKLRAARKKLNLSQSEAAKEWGIPLRSIQNWEQNAATPRGFALTSLNQMLDAILDGEA